MNYIFDFDGTIADNLDESISLINKILVQEGVKPVSRNEVRTQGVKRVIASRNLSKVKLTIFLLKARLEISKEMSLIKPVPGLPKIIRALSRTHTLGIISSNSRSNIVTFLRRTGLDDSFEFLNDERGFFDKYRKIREIVKRHGFNPEETLYIGDEGRDVEAAKRVGIRSVAVSWGFEERKVLEIYMADKLVDKPSELLHLDFD